MVVSASHKIQQRRPSTADQFAVHIQWQGIDPMLPEREYMICFDEVAVVGKVTDLVHRIGGSSGKKLAAKKLNQSEVGYCKLATNVPVSFATDTDDPLAYSFTLLNQSSSEVVGSGTVDFILWRSDNVGWHTMKVDKTARAAANKQKPCVLWFTGLSASGKSTIADQLENKLHSLGHRTYLLDGDNLRHGLNKDLGFTNVDRVENIRRVAEVSKLMVDAGLIVIASFISPFRADRQMARSIVDDSEFFEIFVDTPLHVCKDRDPKGLYKKALAGEIKNFTGIDSEYEPPLSPDIVLKASKFDPNDLANQVISQIPLLSDAPYL